MFATVLIVIGIVLILLFALADFLGIGQAPQFGGRQSLGVLLGAVLGLIGVILRRRMRRKG